MSVYPQLALLFQNHQSLLQKIEQDDPRGWVRSRYELMISKAREAGVSGIEKLVRDCDDSADACSKFKNLMHEVMVALYFQNCSFKASILRDCEFGDDLIYTPDLKIITNEGCEVLVEVTCRSSGATAMSQPIDEMIENGQFPFRISYALGSNLSSSAIDNVARTVQDKDVKKIIDLATDEFTKLSATPAVSGLIIIRDLGQAAEIRPEVESDEAWEIMWEREDFIVCFQFEPTMAGPGYTSDGFTSVHILPRDKLQPAFLYEIKRKAVKRDKLPMEKHNLPFIVAYICEESELIPEITKSTLTGHTTGRSATNEERKKWVASSRAQKSKLVQDAIAHAYQNQWGATLDDWGHGSEGLMAFHEDGLYLDAVHKSDFNWGQNLTGVLILRSNGTQCQWLPNPFSKDASTTSWIQSWLQ
jgi:hypothetical protein